MNSTPAQTLNDTARRFLERAEHYASILDGADQQWDAPTPCEGWTVRDVVAHTLDTERNFLATRELPLAKAPDHADPALAWRHHAAAVVAVLGQEGVAEHEYDGYFGRTTIAATMADFYGWDLVIHGWDVARATGQPWSLSDDEVASLSATADGWGPALHSDGVCGPEVEVAPSAPAYEKLLARLGRDPHWSA